MNAGAAAKKHETAYIRQRPSFLRNSRVLLIAAHPDDEVIGAGIQMTRWNPEQVTFIHVTDGSPLDPKHAQAAGFDTREEYATERRSELGRALKLAGMGEARCLELGYVDQQAHLHLVELVERLAELIAEIRPSVIYAHPYEGGHPDHDAIAFAINLSAGLRPASGGRPESRVTVIEFTSYHGGPDGLVRNAFLQSGAVQTNMLTPSERALKFEMFQCFKSQEPVLRDFLIAEEKFRTAPQYDFTKPPHSGPLHYETLGWNITGEDWRRRAGEAVEMLQLKRTG